MSKYWKQEYWQEIGDEDDLQELQQEGMIPDQSQQICILTVLGEEIIKTVPS